MDTEQDPEIPRLVLIEHSTDEVQTIGAGVGVKRQGAQISKIESSETKRMRIKQQSQNYESQMPEQGSMFTSNQELNFSKSLAPISKLHQVRFANVCGYENRRNEVLYMPPLVNTPSQEDKEATYGKLLVYFGSDYQDFYKQMKYSARGKRFLTYNLDSTAAELQNSFPSHHIFVIRPSNINRGVVSSYDNFVPSLDSEIGVRVPDYSVNNEAVTHLWKLINNLGIELFGKETLNQSEVVRKDGDEENRVIFKRCDLTLIGLGKGCTVLNQLLYEFHYIRTLLPENSKFDPFLESVKDMYFLNPMHQGPKGVYINKCSILDTANRLGIQFHLHLSAYTPIAHEKFKMIGQEEAIFTGKLQQLGAKVKRYVHYEKLPPASLLHFQVLTKLKDESILDTLEIETTKSFTIGRKNQSI